MSEKKHKLPDIVEATAHFEKWASRHVRMVQSDVRLKHRYMAKSAFPFFRATFYRWAQWWPLVCPHLARAPDIVRLVASCYLAIEEQHLSVTRTEACRAIEQGYRDSLAKGGAPFVLAEHHRWLRLVALNKLRDLVVFWEKIRNCPRYKGNLPKDVLKLLHTSMPLRALNYDLKSRVAGLGSLGHPRVLALAEWHGAHIVREAKQLAPSAWIWAKGLDTTEILSRKLVTSAVRILDPHVHFAEHWIVRRLAPDCCHIEIQTLPEERDEARLLYYMGWETANIHLGSRKAIPAVRRDLAARNDRWVHKAAKAMLKVTLEDWKLWRRNRGHVH